MITEKENYLRCYRGEMPEWVPRMGPASPGKHPACVSLIPRFLNGFQIPELQRDVWGVEYVGTENTGGALLPVPGKHIIEDITEWRDILHAPDISDLDWEAMAKEDLKNIDREQTALQICVHGGYFQELVNFMGYENGLCALYEEPEEVKAMLSYLNDFYAAFTEKALEYYKPDILMACDDMATSIQPFVSLDLFREFFRPMHERELELAKKAGCFLDMHCCGKCELFVDDWVEMGIQSWNPAQVSNDLVGIQKKYGDRLVLIGCWDSQGPAGWLHTDEETTRAAVRRCIDQFAGNGKFIFQASIYGSPNDPQFINKRRWIAEEYESYGRSFYQQPDKTRALRSRIYSR